MRSPSTRTRRLAAFMAGPLAVVAAGAMVLQSSYAAFEAETRNSGNSWSTGQVTLSDDDSGAARFAVTNMVPGDTANRCITVTSTANVPGVVKLYFINPTSTPSATGLEGYVTLNVEQGTGGSFAGGTGSCTGFVADTGGNILPDHTLYDAALNHSSWSAAVGSWAVTGGTKTFKFTWTFSASAPDTVQNSHFGIDFEWEMQNS